jgi:hypothetical protein
MDLTEILSKEVEVNGNNAILDVDVEEPVIDEVIETENNIDNGVETVEEIPNTERPKAMPHGHFAANLVGLIDGLQSSLIPMWRKNSLFTAKELEILDGLDTTGGTAYPQNSPEQKVLAKWNKHLNFASQLPFNESEKERLTAATERYAATMQIQVSPLTGLLMAFGEVAGTRAVLFLNE